MSNIGNEAAPDVTRAPTSASPAARGSRRLLAGGVLLVALGLVGAGTTAGFWLHERYASPPAPVLDVNEVASSGATDLVTGTVVLPYVVALAKADAEDALADAGVDLSTVTAKEVPWAGAPGLVVAQEPRRGARNPTSVVLTVARATQVPALVGKPVADAVAQLERLGAEVARVPVYKVGAKLGQVLAVEPAAGKPLGDRVVLRVAGEAAAVYLDAVATARGGCSQESVEVAGRTFDHALRCGGGSTGSPRETGYLLDAGIDRLETVIAAPADGVAVRVRILLKGKVLAVRTAAPGKVEELSLPLAGGGELVFEATGLDGSSGAQWYLGDPRLLGSVAAVDRQAASS